MDDQIIDRLFFDPFDLTFLKHIDFAIDPNGYMYLEIKMYDGRTLYFKQIKVLK